MIRDNLDTLHRMAEALLEKETLDSRDLDEIMGQDGSPKEEGVGEAEAS